MTASSEITIFSEKAMQEVTMNIKQGKQNPAPIIQVMICLTTGKQVGSLNNAYIPMMLRMRTTLDTIMDAINREREQLR
jgi:hypothetical protein